MECSSYSELKGVSGKSQIQEGLLKVRDIFHPHPVFEPWVRGSFDLEDVLHQFKADFLPHRFKEMIENTESVSGTMEGTGPIQGTKPPWSHRR